MTTISLPEIAEIVWRTTAAWRVTTYHDGGHCPTKRAPYGIDDPRAELIAEECVRAGCLDLVHELWEYVNVTLGSEKVQRRLGQVDNLGGYIRLMVTRRLSDTRRQERVKRGFPARTNRSDGAPGRVIAALLEREGDRGQWLVQLFRILRSTPFGANHVPGHWPISGLITEYRNTHGKVLEEAQVLADIKTVLGVAREILGVGWVHDNLTLPVHSSRHCEVLSATSALAEPPTVEHLELSILLSHYRRLRRMGRCEDDAVREAVRRTFGIEITVNREIREALEEFQQDWALSHGRAGEKQ